MIKKRKCKRTRWYSWALMRETRENLRQRIEADLNQVIQCPDCGSSHAVGNGYTQNGGVRYRCRRCDKSWTYHLPDQDNPFLS